MAIIAVPPELMTPTAAGLLEAAAALGLPASVVATNSDTPLGIGFVVPDEVAEKWNAPRAAGEPGIPEVAEKPRVAEPVQRRRGPRKPETEV